MVVSVTVRIRDKGTFAYLRGISKRTKKFGPRETWNLTQFGAKAIRQSAMNAGIHDWRGLLLHKPKGIEARKLGKNRYGIFIPWYGIRLDTMRDHWVSLKRGRTITEWAKTSPNSPFRGKKLPRAIKVRRHPFIDRGYQNMLNRADIYARRIANKIIGG